MIRTIVCASSDLARAGLAVIVRGDARLTLVAESAPADVARGIATFAPDVLLEDLGIEHAPVRVLKQRASVRVANVALVDDPRAAWLADRLDGADRGPHAILARDAPASEIVAAIVAVAAGLVAVQPRALAFASEAGGLERTDSPRAVERDDEPLTPRERGVLAELARGVPNKTIAARLGISEHTVKFHVASIFAKLDVASRTEAVTQGMRLGLVML